LSSGKNIGGGVPHSSNTGGLIVVVVVLTKNRLFGIAKQKSLELTSSSSLMTTSMGGHPHPPPSPQEYRPRINRASEELARHRRDPDLPIELQLTMEGRLYEVRKGSWMSGETGGGGGGGGL